jgi:hypothetical protein
MSVVAEVVTEETYDSVFVLDKRGSIRGKSALSEQNGRKLSYITVFGNSQDEALYFFLNNINGTLPANRNFNFVPDMIMGTIKEPVKLAVSNENEMTVYPNMFSREFNLQFHAQREQETEINFVDRVGRTVYTAPASIRKGYNQIEVQPDVPGGLYILSIVVDGQKRTFKVVKK